MVRTVPANCDIEIDVEERSGKGDLSVRTNFILGKVRSIRIRGLRPTETIDQPAETP